MIFDPNSAMLNGYSSNDGTIEFYGRINSLLRYEFVVLDLGAGRAEWFEDDSCAYRRDIRLIRGKVSKVIALDVDPIVIKNRSCDESVVMKDNHIPLESSSIDLIIADFVFEHVEDPDTFKREINRILRPGGYLCARTPHGASYVSFAARLVKNTYHPKLLRFIQPNRKPEDVFPTNYRINSLIRIRALFKGYSNYSYIFRPDPSYFFGSSVIYHFQSFIHRVMPSFFSGCIFVFLRKPL